MASTGSMISEMAAGLELFAYACISPYVATCTSIVADKGARKAHSLQGRYDQGSWQHTALKISSWSLVAIAAIGVAIAGSVAILSIFGGFVFVSGGPQLQLLGLFLLINGIGSLKAAQYGAKDLIRTVVDLRKSALEA